MSMMTALDEMGIRVDGESSSMFFARQLEHVKGQAYDVIRAPLRAFELLPVSSEAEAGAESIVYNQFDMTGIAKVIANYADDLPRADVKGKQFVARVKSIGNAYGYSVQEVRNAQMAGRNLEQRKANAAARAQREAWNKIAFFGDDANGLQGWLTNTNIPSSAVVDDGGKALGEAGGDTEFDKKTPEQILRDLNDLANTIVEDTHGAEQPNTVALPIKQYTKIASTRAADGTDTTILEYFIQNNPFIERVEWANELASSQLDDNLDSNPFTGDIMIAYNNDPDKLTLEMPQMFEQFPVQERNLAFVVPCHSRIAGVIVYYPLSMRIAEGI
jgi:hypothetical protein